MRVLIVDDHRIVASGCRALFADDPEIDILEASDAESGEREFSERHPDICVLDINLRGTFFLTQAALREGWVDMVGLGRMVLTYPEFLWDATEGRSIERKRICRTFSDCTTAPRNGLPSGCYPLDRHYKDSTMMELLNIAKKQ